MYLSFYCGFPITRNNKIKYYSSGENFYQQVKKELNMTEKFIFIEFFTIATGNLWEEVLEILKKR